MQKWEYTMIVGDLQVYKKERGKWVPEEKRWDYDLSHLWDAPWKDKTTFTSILELGREGWELVSAIPNNADGFTSKILFTFKRPILD